MVEIVQISQNHDVTLRMTTYALKQILLTVTRQNKVDKYDAI